MEIRCQSWPADPVQAVAILRKNLPGWRVTYAPGVYRASRARAFGTETIESRSPGEVVAAIEDFDDEVPR